MSYVKINPELRTTTTFKIDETLLKICKIKTLSIQEILRETFQFLFVLHFENLNVETIIQEIIDEYSKSETIPLTNSYKVVITHITKKQRVAYESINIENRVFYLNKLISTVVNNDTYFSIKNNCTILKDRIINQYTLDFFLNSYKLSTDIDIEHKIILMKSILTKINHLLKCNYLTETRHYNELYNIIFSKNIIKDFQNQALLTNFLYKEFRKIYFAMIKIFNIQLNLESSTSFTRTINKEFMSIYKEKYNKNITLFIENEIIIDKEYNKNTQVENFSNFMIDIHPGKQEKKVREHFQERIDSQRIQDLNTMLTDLKILLQT